MTSRHKNPSDTSGDSSPARGATSGKPPLRGEVARSDEGVSLASTEGLVECNAAGVQHRKTLFTIDDIRKRGLVWDGNSLPYNPSLVVRARDLRRNMTKPEKKLWYEFLKSHEMKFYRQRPIDHFIADFYCSKCSLIVELDGSQHYTAEGLERDAVRTDILALYGLRVVRFTNRDVLDRFESVCRAINAQLQWDRF